MVTVGVGTAVGNGGYAECAAAAAECDDGKNN